MDKSLIVVAIAGILVGLFVLSYAIGDRLFEGSINTTYSQYTLAGEGKLSMSTDCVGNKIFAIGSFNIPQEATTCSSYRYENARSFLRGGDCEYKVYKGWYWGKGDFYYIAPK